MKKDMRTIKPVGKGIHTERSFLKTQALSSSKSFVQDGFLQGLALPVLASAKALAFGTRFKNGPSKQVQLQWS